MKRDSVEFCSNLYVYKNTNNDKNSQNWFSLSAVKNFFIETREETQIEYDILHWVVEALDADGIQAAYEFDDANMSRVNVRLVNRCFSICTGCCQTTKPPGYKRSLHITMTSCNLLDALSLTRTTDCQESVDRILDVMYKAIMANPNISRCSIMEHSRHQGTIRDN